MLSTKTDAELLQLERDVEDALIHSARHGKILAFTKLTFPEYEINWHHRLLAKYLNKFLAKEIRRLMVFMPPRTGKSELTSRRLPALWHGLYPNDELLMATYNGELAGDMTTDIQRIMDKPTYHKIFPQVRITKEGRRSSYIRSKHEHEIMPYQDPNDRLWHWWTGSFRSAGVGGSFTGRGANCILIDDPLKNREDADSATIRENIWKFYASTLRTRLEGEGSVLLTMTRWHDDDLAGRLEKLMETDPDADQWTIIRLPAIKENDNNPEDPRQIGEPLWATKFGPKEVRAIKGSVGMREWSALYQQSPVTEGGNIIKEEWIKYYDYLPDNLDFMVQSWDFAAKDKTTSDYTVGQVWGVKGSNRYLIDQIRGRFNFPDSCQKLKELTLRHPKAYRKLVEGKANGPAVIQTLQNTVFGLVEVEPRGDKVARLNAVSTEFEAGNVWLPRPDKFYWMKDYLRELFSFPSSINDDQVDATTQALDDLRSEKSILDVL